MLNDLIMDLLATQPDTPERENAFRMLEKVGVDRRTARVIATDFDKDWR